MDFLRVAEFQLRVDFNRTVSNMAIEFRFISRAFWPPLAKLFDLGQSDRNENVVKQPVSKLQQQYPFSKSGSDK